MLLPIAVTICESPAMVPCSTGEGWLLQRPEPVPSSPVKGTSIAGQGSSRGLDVQSHAPVPEGAHTSQPGSLSDVPGHIQNALMQAPGI